MSVRRAVVVGAGFGGLTSALLLAKKGFAVTIVEKNSEPGGRARVWKEKGFTFDMGPSWYLMPEVFENFFEALGRKRTDYYQLRRLNPGYRVYFGEGEKVEITADLSQTLALFESFEAGGGARLRKYLDVARYEYEVAMREFMDVDYRSILQFLNRKMLVEGLKLHVFEKLDRYVTRFFTDRRAQQILEYATVFLGSSPHDTPAMYSLMSHLDMEQGVFYPDGGLGKVVDTLVELCGEFGVRIITGAPVTGVRTEKGLAKAVLTPEGEITADLFVMNADYHHVEQDLLAPGVRNYSENWWSRKTLAPTLMMIYLGVNKRVPELLHHNLSFTAHWEKHFDSIFKKPAWPENPNLYVSVTSRTDPSVAPEGCENLVLLVPLAPGLDETDREAYAEAIVVQFEELAGVSLRNNLLVKRVYAGSDYLKDYNAYKGSALGLSHTLLQTAIFRPSMRNKKLKNLFYTGQYTHPGIGVPMAFIGSKILVAAVGEP